MGQPRRNFLADCAKITKSGSEITLKRLTEENRESTAVSQMLLACVRSGQLNVGLGEDKVSRVYSITKQGIEYIEDSNTMRSLKSMDSNIYTVLKGIKENQPVEQSVLNKSVGIGYDVRGYIGSLFDFGFLERTDPSKRPIKYSVKEQALKDAGIELD